MAALMRCARLCVPIVQIPKLLRVTSSASSQTSVDHFISNKRDAVQRSRHSTFADGLEAQQTRQSEVETLIDRAQSLAFRVKRVSRKDLDRIVTTVEKEGYISRQDSMTLLHMYGSVLGEESPAGRLKLAQELWEKYKSLDVPLVVSHYNVLLEIYNQNKFKFSPTEFLAKMEADGISPNRITYQRLIARFCDEGDIQGATQVLEHMKSASLPINEQVFNSFITGHLRNNDPDNARNIVEVMRQAGLEPTNATFTTLAVGFAEKGDFGEVKKHITQAEIEGVPLQPSQLMEVYVALTESGQTEHLQEIITFIQSRKPFNYDAIRVCNQLIATNHDDAAYQLFTSMDRPIRIDADEAVLGRFLLRALARHQRPVDKVAEIAQDMQDKGLNKDGLNSVAHLAYLENQPDYALSILEKMKSEGQPIRPHYFWPALCQFRDLQDKDRIYQVMEKLFTLSDTMDDILYTLHNLTIPTLLSLDESQSDILTKLKDCGFEEKMVNFAFLLYLLENRPFQEASDFLDSHQVAVYMGGVRSSFVMSVNSAADWQTMLEIMSKLKSQSSSWRDFALSATAEVLRRILIQQREAGWTDLQDIFTFMADKDLKVRASDQPVLLRVLTDAPAEMKEKLTDLMVSRGPTGQAAEVQGLTERELTELMEKNQNNLRIQKDVLNKFCALGAVEEADKLRSRLEERGFVFSPDILAQLGYLYSRFAKDLEKAQRFIQQLESRFPEYSSYQTSVLAMAALQVSAGNVDAAVDTLQKYADKHHPEKYPINQKYYFTNIVDGVNDADAARRVMDTLFDCKYLPQGDPVLLNSYMGKLVEGGDADKILQEFEDIYAKQKQLPAKDEVLKFFIKKEDPDRLQKVVDLMTQEYGQMNVLHHLIANLIECGHVKKARKIMETPGLRAHMPRLDYHCQKFIERNMIKELETLVEVTKEMFNINRDKMLYHLMRGYVGQNELDKANDILLQYEEELVRPSDLTLQFLARSLQRAGRPVPFEVPEIQPVQKSERTEETVQKPATTRTPPQSQPQKDVDEAVAKLQACIEKGEVEEALATLQGSEERLLASTINRMNRPLPGNALKSIFESLGDEGSLVPLMRINQRRLPNFLGDSLKANIFTASINSNQAEDLISKMETQSYNMDRHLTFSTLDLLHSKAPQLVDRVKNLAKKQWTETEKLRALSKLWCYYKYNNSPQADEILKEVPGFEKHVHVRPLCQAALAENRIDAVEPVLKMKRDVEDKAGMAAVYTYLLLHHGGKGDIEAVERTCEGILGDGITRADLHDNVVSRTEDLLKEQNKPLPAWGEPSSSSESDSSSSSEEEKR